MPRAADFTTFVSVQQDQSSSRVFSDLERQARRAYGAVAQAAAEASAQTSRLLGGGGGVGNVSGITSALRAQAAEARSVAQANSSVSRSAADSISNTRALGMAAATTAGQSQFLSRSLRTTAEALQVVQGPLGPLAGRISAAGRALVTLTGVQIGAASVAGLAFVVARVGNEYQTLQARLRAYFPDQKQVNNAMADIVKISRDSRTSLEATAALYTRLSQSATQFHLTQVDVAKITRTATQAAVLSGSPAQTQQAGLYELSAGLEAGRLQGRQLRAILIDLPQLGQAIARGLGVTVGQLRELGTQGVLTTEAVAHALENSSAAVNTQFQRMPVTLGQAGVAFKNAFTVAVGQFDQAIGFSSNLAKLILAIADNLHLVLSVAGGVAATFAAIKVGGWASSISSTVQAMQSWQRVAVGIATATQAQATASAAAAAAQLEQANAASAAAEAEIARLETEIALTAELRNQQLAILQQGPLAGVGGATAFNSSSYRAAAAAEAEGQQTLSILTQDLTRAKQAQAAATATQTAATEANVAAQAEMNTVMATGIGTSGAFATAMRSILTTGNLLIVAVTAVAAGLIYYATQQSAAQRATDTARQAMSDYSDVVDQTTGKVKALTVAEGQRAEAKARQTIADFETGTGASGRQSLVQNVRDLGLKTRALPGVGTPVALPGQDALEARNQRIAGLLSGAGTYDQGIAQISALANAGDQAAKKWLADNDKIIQSTGDLAKAAKAAQVEITVLHGGTDPAELERRALTDAQRKAQAQSIIAERRQAIAEANTLDDNALYNKNLKTTYKAFSEVGVLSPDEIQARQATIKALQSAPIPPGQEVERKRSIRQQIEDLNEAIRITGQYKGTIEELAHAQTKADTAQRDANRQLHLDNETERKALQQAKATATATLNAQLLTLEQNRRNMTPEAYHSAEVALLKTYDDQISALDQRANASDRATTRAIENARRENQIYEQFDQQRQNILTRYTDEPKPAQRADNDIRRLQQFQGAIGSGIYTNAQLQQDIALIQNGLERPYREYLRDQEQSYQVQLLQLQGHDVEAQALQRAFQLHNQIGKLSDDQYQTILAQTAQEQQINDLLAARGRIYGTITGAVDETRQQLTTLITNLPTQGGKAAGSFAQSVLGSFQKIQVTGLVENLTSGLDERVRALISGRNAVDSASRYFAAQINSTSTTLSTSATSIMSLGTAAETTSSTMLTAAQTFAAGMSDTMASFRAGIGNAGAAKISERETPEWPLPGHTGISSGLQQRINPVTGKSEFHQGLDIPAPLGTAVMAALGGKVVPNTHGAGFGNAVQIDVGNGLQTLYGHLSSIDVHLGQVVRQGQEIGRVGSTGISTGNHLHYGAYQNGKAIDPRGISGALVDAVGNQQFGPDTNLISLQQTVGGLIDDSVQGRMEALFKPEQLGNFSISQGQLAKAAQLPSAAYAALGTQDPSLSAQLSRVGLSGLPTAKQTYNVIGEAVGDRLDKALGTKFFGGIGKSFGTALQGAGTGAIAAGFMKALGIKTSQTGAEIGGALGKLTGIPGADIIGSIAGGIIGGLFKKPKAGAATLTTNQFGEAIVGTATGNDAASKSNASTIGSNVGNALQSIASALGGQLQGGLSVSLGYRASDKNQPYRVDPTGAGRSSGNGVQAFATQEEAIAAAVSDMLQKGVIAGISAASKKILEEGQDLQTEINKAVAIESIPKQLKALTDPVGAAVDTLNTQFTTLISYLKEGGATAEQFAQAQQLYDAERTQAITAAEQQATGVITDLITQLTATTSSPLNKRTVYENALATLQPLQSDVLAGKSVDVNKLAAAAQNFESASQTLNGSDSAFFADFNTVVDLLNKAKANVNDSTAAVNRTDLPASPFTTDTAVQDAIASLNNDATGAINNGTSIIGGKLDTLIGLVQGGGSSGSGSFQDNGTIGLLPGFAGSGIGAMIRMNSE